MTYNPRRTFEAGRGSIYSSYKPPSSSNANKQAYQSMASVGIGGMSGKPTTSSAKKIQDRFRRETQKRNTGGYDPVGGGSVDDPGYKGPGLGSPPDTGGSNNKDDSSQESFMEKLMNKVKSSFNFAGGATQNEEPTDPDPVSVYISDVFEIPTIQVGFPNPNPMRSGEEIAADIAKMFDTSKDKGYYQYSTEEGSRYDEVPAASANKNLEVNKTRSAVERLLKDVLGTKAKEYKIKKGDTLSEIALREGVTVDDLVKVNGIENKDRIYADETLIIPNSQDMEKAKDIALRVTTSGDEMERFEGEVDLTDPQSEFNQSTIPEEDREFEPELGAEAQSVTGYDDVPQMVRGLMSKTNIVKEDFDTSDVESSRVAYESVKKVQKRLNDLGYTTLVGDLKVDGKLGGGTARQLRKFQATAGLPVTAASGQPVDEATMKALKNNKFNNKEGKDSKATVTPLQDGLFEIIKAPIAKIESGGEAQPYATVGGDGMQYDGKYQFGWRAKTDLRNNPDITPEEAAKLQQMQLKEFNKLSDEDKARVGPQIQASRAAFRDDPDLQEKVFRLYVDQNHATLTKNSAKYRAMDQANQLAVLGYAHNQGAENALEWLTTSVSGTDAFGTKGDKYSEAITEIFTKDDMLG